MPQDPIFIYAVDNDPLNLTDPDGHCYPACTVIGGAIIGGTVGGGYYLAHAYLTGSRPSLGGFLASTAEGAVVGGVAGTGVGTLGEFGTLAGVGAGSHAAAQLVTAASANNLGRYGTTTLSTATTVFGDAAVGAGGAVFGQFSATKQRP